MKKENRMTDRMKGKRASVGKAIEKLVKAGKPLSGLLVGMASTVGVAAASEVSAPRLAGEPLPSRVVVTNKVSEVRERVPRGRIANGRQVPLQGKLPVPVLPKVELPPVSAGQYRVALGDTLSKIAKRHKTTVAELKRLNGFDDVRANNIKVGEVIRVAPEPKPVQKPAPEPVSPAATNSVNEVTAPMMEDGDILMGEIPVE